MSTATAELIEITEAAKAQIRVVFETEKPGDDQGLRLGVVGGGCSGLSYLIEVSDPRAGDHVIEHDGFKVFIDAKSAIYLKGVTLDYASGLAGKGFVFSNPNASNTCGCGESFTV